MSNDKKFTNEADDNKSENENGGKKKLNYSAYYNDIIVREQPFYNIDKTYKGKYVPLKKQDLFK
ncbi:MAG: hypothetical protein IJ224_05425 [Lachnospiraceae bacterium]|nr:hypothetical protein [Lachnospiraceae bacterium]